MKRWLLLVPMAALVALSSCTPKEEEVEPDYDNMVMADDEEDDWISDEEKDRKVIAGDLPDPYEQLIVEPSELDIKGSDEAPR